MNILDPSRLLPGNPFYPPAAVRDLILRLLKHLLDGQWSVHRHSKPRMKAGNRYELNPEDIARCRTLDILIAIGGCFLNEPRPQNPFDYVLGIRSCFAEHP